MSPKDIIAAVAKGLDLVKEQVSSGAPCAMPPAPSGGITELIPQLLEANRQIWELEDLARSPHATAETLARIKRDIDPRNQLRNDCMNAIDVKVYAAFAGMVNLPELPFNSESIGSIIDRFTVLSLKVHHLLKLAADGEADAPRKRELAARCALMRVRLRDCAVDILGRTLEGKATLMDFRQIKLYNDPALNPMLRAEVKREAA